MNNSELHGQLDAVTPKGGAPITSLSDPNLPAGIILANERKAQNKTVEEIAKALNLSASTIRALESDQADALPELTYVRGYIRSYARLLGLDPEKVIVAYSNDFEGSGRVKFDEIPQGLSEQDFQGSSQRSTWLKWGLIVGVLALLYYWWSPEFIQDWFADNARERPVASTTQVASNENTTPTPVDQGAISIERTESTENAAEPQIFSPLVSLQNSNQETTTANSGTEQNTVVAAPSNDLPVTQTTAAGVVATEQGVADAVVDASATELLLKFASTCWVDARDSEGTRLAYQTVAGGEQLELTSAAAITVFLGNAEGVTATLNGEDFDLTQFRQGVYAKFTVPAPDTTDQ